MAENSKIEWTDHTFNPWSGCTKVSPACDICYAEVNYSVKMRGVKWGKYGNRIIAADSMWKQPLAWNRKAEAEGVRKRVFCASLADVFEGQESMPQVAWEAVQDARKRLWDLIEHTRNLDWLLLTKRPENVMTLSPERWRTRCTFEGEYAERFPSNVWIGTTVENQKYADIRIPELLKIPAKVRFLSIEPLLGPIDLRAVKTSCGADALTCSCSNSEALSGRCDIHPTVDWVIVGGESGGLKARPMSPDWVRSIRDDCIAANVAFHFKQYGEWLPCSQATTDQQKIIIGASMAKPQPNKWHTFDGLTHQIRVGKHEAGRILDGRTWDEMPEVSR